MKKLVNVATLVLDKCYGREKQVTDMQHVAYLLSLLEAGVKFLTPILITADNVVVDGHHRTEAYIQFLGKLPEEQRVIEVEVTDEMWAKSGQKTQVVLSLRAYKANVHPNGKGSGTRDLRYQVGKMIDFGYNDKQIVAALLPEITSDQTKKAIQDYNTVCTQAAVRHAQDLKREGVSDTKARKIAGLPDNYHIPERGEVERDRLHKITTQAQKTASNWSRFANTRIVTYRETGRGQNALVKMATTMQAAAAILSRKAASIQEQANGAVDERAQRERRA